MGTIVDLLRRLVVTRPADRAFLVVDEDATWVSYAELDAAAHRIGQALSARGVAGKPVLLLFPPGRSYVEGFFGCLYAGAIAVPTYPPDPSRLSRTVPRLRSLVRDCGATVALTTSFMVAAGLAEVVRAGVSGAPELAAMDWIATDALPLAAAGADVPPRLPAHTPALLQYTSGSTGEPKGVLISHANLMHNAELVRTGFGTTSESVGVSWLPPYHDMGLIGGIVQPIYVGLPVVLMSPLTFLNRPMTWLEAISRFGATVSGGPNFAFDLCVRKSTPQERAELDLSRWSVAFCGAEPVRAETLDRFAAAFGPAGFCPEAFYPCYGLAEGTLIVTGGRPAELPRRIRHGGVVHVGCGQALGDQTVAVVDPQTRIACAPGAIGEVWLCGPSVATGYWKRPDDTRHTFLAVRADDPDRRYLRTGDLGFLDPSGELVVTGRAKDLIIIRGRNVYPQDLEHAVENRVAGVRPGCSAAFPVERDGAEQVAVACEVAVDAHVPDVLAAVRRALTEAADIGPATVVLLRPRCIPKTSSGKVQRYACRRALEAGEWEIGRADVVARWEAPTAALATHDADVVGVVAGALGIDRHDVPLDGPLTELGLDSLQAVELRHALDARFGVDVSVSELLAGISATALAERAAEAPVGEAPVGEAPAENAARTMTDGQRALWFVQHLAPESTAYQITRAARIRSPLRAPALDRALRALVARHPALRTRFPSGPGEPTSGEFPWDGPVLDHHAATLDEDALRERIEAAAARGFDLANGPLFRASLYSRGPDDHVLLLSVHHIVADFWSLSVLADDLFTLYAAELAGTEADLPALVDTSVRPVDHPAHLEYWRRTLSGAPSAVELPTTYPRPRLQSFRGATYDFRIDGGVLKELDTVARRAGTTRFVALTAGFAALLSRYAGDDVVVGAPTAGRDDRGTARRVGYLVNPVPLRIRLRPEWTFRQLVGDVRRVVLEALDHAVPFPRLVEAIRPVRDPGRSPVVQVSLTLLTPPPGSPDLGAFAVADETARIRLRELDLTPYRLAQRGSPFDLSLMAAERPDGLSCTMEYCADLFDVAAVARLCRQLTMLLAAAGAAPDAPVATLDIMDTTERAAVLAFADGDHRPMDAPATLPAWFGRQVDRHRDATAVVAGGRTLTYAELDAVANRLAARLRDRYGVGRGSVVGVHLPRGLDWVVAFWAVLKAGGVYLPLPPDLPDRRLAWLVADAGPVVVLTHREIEDLRPACGGRPPAEIEPDDLAYLLYTSGSTGRPKGVLVPHRGACNVARAEATALGITGSDRVLQYASSAFDVSVVEILIAHLHGAALHIAPAQTDLVRLLAEQRITAAALSPSVLAALPDAPLPDLRGLIIGGEECPADLVARWATARRIINAYGPTEATICATLGACRADGTRPPIGRPIPNVRAYVLDTRMALVPIGVPGELYLGGVGVARGYLSRPGLTAERFVPDPFGTDPGARLYRTGDRARWLPDGTLDFLGRLDDQVKIRGVRIEPGEIEARLRAASGAREVAVVPRPGPGGGTELVAYLVTNGARPPVAELRGRLRAELPGPWIPAAFVHLDRLPRLTSGKLDRRALPAPTSGDRGAAEPLSPRNGLETVIAQIWAAALGREDVGVRDHFFDELGGSSLLVVTVTSELGARLERHVPVTDMFEHPTVEALARHLAGGGPPDGRAEHRAEGRRRALASRRRRRN